MVFVVLLCFLCSPVLTSHDGCPFHGWEEQNTVHTNAHTQMRTFFRGWEEQTTHKRTHTIANILARMGRANYTQTHTHKCELSWEEIATRMSRKHLILFAGRSFNTSDRTDRVTLRAKEGEPWSWIVAGILSIQDNRNHFFSLQFPKFPDTPFGMRTLFERKNNHLNFP